MAKKENSSESAKKEEKTVFSKIENNYIIGILSNKRLNRTTLLLYLNVPNGYVYALVNKETTPQLEELILEEELKGALYEEVKKLHNQGNGTKEKIEQARKKQQNESNKKVKDDQPRKSKLRFSLFKSDDKKYDIERMKYFQFHLPGSDHQIEQVIIPLIINGKEITINLITGDNFDVINN